jgi:hypothetical protein
LDAAAREAAIGQASHPAQSREIRKIQVGLRLVD